MSVIIPAVLARSRKELERTLERFDRATVVQIDVVDGQFAAPPSWPYTEGTERPADVDLPPCFDADLMVAHPERVADSWLAAGAARLTLHLESLEEPARTLAALMAKHGHDRATGPCPFELGLALGVSTDLAALDPFLAQLDYVQLMGIDTIGRQGEPFDPVTIARVRALRRRSPKLLIQVDGGVTAETIPALIEAGADRLVIGHTITQAKDPAAALAAFEASVARGAQRTAATPVTDGDIAALAEKANELRQTIVEMLTTAGSGHTAGPLGMADVFTALYFHLLVHNPRDPEWPGRDRLVLSNGHIVPVRYAAMAHAGYFPIAECATLRKFGSRLQGHPERTRLPGLETTSGPLGEGLAQAAGMAYALRLDRAKNRVYCVMSDGEQQEGNTWEAVLFAGKYRLGNLTAIMDRNNIQIDGMTEDVMPLENMRAKYEAFNWHVLETNGNDIRAFIVAVEESKAIYEKPTLIIAHTIPGKGVKEIEFDYRWHGVPPGGGPEDVWKKKEQAAAMLRELRTLGGRVISEHQ